MNVLSLFDGCAVARVALDRLEISCTYYASEIDKWAVQIAHKNYPDIIQLGDVRQIYPLDLPLIDLLIGGSPCQDLSIAGQQKGLNGERSGLFYEYIWLLSALQPKYFLLENVVMKYLWQWIFNIYTGVKPVQINSALVSAQNRERLYWTNIPNVAQPEDQHILLRDIIEDGLVDRDKSYCIDANYYKGGNLNSYLNKARRQLVFDSTENQLMVYRLAHGYMQEKLSKLDKYPTLAAQSPRTKHLLVDNLVVRMLTPVECERLQTLPDNYTEGVSKTQRYKMLGNAFTADIIKHILSFIPRGDYDERTHNNF